MMIRAIFMCIVAMAKNCGHCTRLMNNSKCSKLLSEVRSSAAVSKQAVDHWKTLQSLEIEMTWNVQHIIINYGFPHTQ